MLASGTSRRLGWAAALVERLFRCISSPTHSEEMVLARTMRWIRQLRILQIKPQTKHTTVQLSTQRILQAAVGTYMAHSSLQGASPRQALGPMRKVVAGALTESGAPAATISPGTATRTRSVEVAERTTYRHVSRPGFLATSPTLLVASRNRTVMRTQQHRLLNVAAVNGIPNRLAKKYSRFDQRPVTDVQRLPAKSPAAAPAEAPIMIDRSQPRLRPEVGKQDISEVGRRTPAVQLESAPNVAQITDAVLKQLDRRLIAARERMGRI